MKHLITLASIALSTLIANARITHDSTPKMMNCHLNAEFFAVAATMALLTNTGPIKIYDKTLQPLKSYIGRKGCQGDEQFFYYLPGPNSISVYACNGDNIDLRFQSIYCE